MNHSSLRRETALEALDRIADDPRCQPDEIRQLDLMRETLNEGRTLDSEQRGYLSRIADAVASRPKSERQSGTELLAALPRPLRPPMARAS